MVDITEGVILEGFELTQELGSGGFGTVYRGESEAGETVAIKVPRDENEHHSVEHIHQALNREAQALSRIMKAGGHPAIMDYYGASTYSGAPVLFLEEIRGRTLFEIMRETGELSADEVARLGRALAAPLSFLHAQGIVYRDLKPDNVMINPESTPPIKLIDFSVATGVNRSVRGDSEYRQPHYKTAAGAAPSDAGEFKDYCGYRPPEADLKYECAYPQGTWSDVFSMGMLLLELLSGEAYDKTNIHPTDIGIDCPAYLDGIIGRATREHPQARYASAAPMASALEQGHVHPEFSTPILDQPATNRPPLRITGDISIGRPAAGRAPDIALKHPWVSKDHCRIIPQGSDQWVLIDNSSNGTYVHLGNDQWKQLGPANERSSEQLSVAGGHGWSVTKAKQDYHYLADGETISLASPYLCRQQSAWQAVDSERCQLLSKDDTPFNWFEFRS